MTDIKKYKISFVTIKGAQEVVVQSFNKQQAKRKLLTHVSNKRDHPVIKKIELMLDA